MRGTWLTPQVADYMAMYYLFGAIVTIAAFGLLVQCTWQRQQVRSKPHGPVLLQPSEPMVAGPVSISGLRLRVRLVYDKGLRFHPRLVTLDAATGHRGTDGKVELDLLHTVCHRYHKPRTFRADRILTATDARGRAIHDLSAWVLTAIDAV